MLCSLARRLWIFFGLLDSFCTDCFPSSVLSFSLSMSMWRLVHFVLWSFFNEYRFLSFFSKQERKKMRKRCYASISTRFWPQWNNCKLLKHGLYCVLNISGYVLIHSCLIALVTKWRKLFYSGPYTQYK